MDGGDEDYPRASYLLLRGEGNYARPNIRLWRELEREESARQPGAVRRRRIEALLGLAALLLLLVALRFWFS